MYFWILISPLIKILVMFSITAMFKIRKDEIAGNLKCQKKKRGKSKYATSAEFVPKKRGNYNTEQLISSHRTRMQMAHRSEGPVEKCLLKGLLVLYSCLIFRVQQFTFGTKLLFNSLFHIITISVSLCMSK